MSRSDQYVNREKNSQRMMGRIKKLGGQFRMAQAIAAGISRRRLYSLRDQGMIEQISRGVYRLSEMPPLSNFDIVAVSIRVPQTVICLVSALSFHNLTTQIPHAVDIALIKGSRIPRIDFPPVSVHRLSKPCFKAGIQEHMIDGVNVKIYDPEKTLVDCFKFRNQIGKEIALEALKFYRARMRLNIDALMGYARVCRVEKVIKPYLEAML